MSLPDYDIEGEYAAWLMANAELHICSSKELVYHLERQTRYEEFLAIANAEMARDSVKF